MATCIKATEVFTKVPAGVLLTGFDFSGQLDVGETLSGATHTITPAGLTLDSESNGDSETNIQLSGGTANVVYTVRAEVTTSRGQTLHADGDVEVCP